MTKVGINTAVPLHIVPLADLPCIDLDVMKHYISSEKDVFEPLLVGFLNSLEAHEMLLLDCFTEKNWLALAAGAHQLHGSAAYFGAGQLLALCRQLQYVTIEADVQQVAPLVEQLQQAFENLRYYRVE